MGLGELGILDFGELKSKVIKIQGPGFGLATYPLLCLLLYIFCSFRKWAGLAGACR